MDNPDSSLNDPDFSLNIPDLRSVRNPDFLLENVEFIITNVDFTIKVYLPSVGPPCLAPESSSFDYEVTVSAAGIYYLTANHTIWHPNQDLVVSTSGSPALTVPVYYTFGWWVESQPIELKLTAGRNILGSPGTSTCKIIGHCCSIENHHLPGQFHRILCL